MLEEVTFDPEEAQLEKLKWQAAIIDKALLRMNLSAQFSLKELNVNIRSGDKQLVSFGCED